MSAPMKRLGDCCEVVSGATPRTDNDAYWGGEIRWATPKDVSALDSSTLYETPDKLTEAGYRSCSTKLVPPGAILVSSRAPIGLVAIAGVEMCTNQGFKTLVPGPELSSSYLYHCMKANADRLASLGNGATFKEVSKTTVENFEIPVPQLEAQLRIAAILDQADSLRRKRQEAIRLADEFLRAAYLDLAQRNPARVLVETLLAEVPNAARTGPFGSQLLVAEFTETGIPVLGIDNVVANTFAWAAPRFISPEKYAELERYTVRPGDVMVTIMGTTGRVAIAPDDLPTCISTKHLCTLTLDRKKMLPTYLWACLRWDPEVRAQTRREAKGAIMEGWNMGIVKGLLVNAPPMDVQLQFEEIANRIKRMSSAQALAAKGTDELMASLSAKYLEPTT